MMIKNLLLTFDHRADGQAIFKLDNGTIVSVPELLLPADFEAGAKYFLAIDKTPLVSGSENKKALLNELLNGDRHE